MRKGSAGALLAVFVAALCIRLLYLWQIGQAPFFDLRIGDAEVYHLWAQRIAGGDWLGQGVFYQAPLYPYFLAVIYRLLDDSVTTVRVIQALLGAGSCTLLAAAGISLFGRRGAIAGLGLAIYPPAIFLDGLLEKSSLVTLLTTALVALLSAALMTVRRWLAAGVMLGLLALTRENALILIAPILLWIGSRRERFPAAAAFAAGCALILLPVGLRNLARGGEVHLTTAQFGPNFYIGNHAGASGTYEALVVGHGSAADEREDATRLAEQAAGHKLTPGEVSSFWTKRSLEYIRAQPIEWLKLMARKFALAFNAAEVSDTESQDVYAEWSWLLRVLRPFDFGLLLGMAALGAVLTMSSWRRIWFLYALAATYALSIALFYVFARYRFPMAPVLMLPAAGGLVEACHLVRARQLRCLGVAGVVAVLAIAFAHLPLDDPRTARATHYAAIASALAKNPERLDTAMEFYRRALDTDPRFPAAQFGIGTLLARNGQPQEAIPHYQAAIASWPAYVEAHHNLGAALAAIGRTQDAAQQYSEALRLHPDDADTKLALARTQLALQRPDLAAAQYQGVLASQPKNAKALIGWAVALTQLGRAPEAIQKYRLALELDPQDATAHNNLGWTLANEGRIAEAVPHFERALALNPNYDEARRNLEQARRLLSH